MSDDKEAMVASGDPLPAVLRNELPLLVDARTLVEGLRYLQQRIPEYTQLSTGEARSMTRVAHLDPEFVEVGLQTAAAWDDTTAVLGRSAEALRRDADEIGNWDEVERELTVLLKGIAAANLKRKHRLGHAILKIYNVLRYSVDTHNRHLRPYFDDMKRAFLKRRKKPGKAEPPAP